MRRVGYEGQAFLTKNGGTGKGAQLRTLLGPYLGRFTGFASTDPNYGDVPLVQGGVAGYNLWQQISLPRLVKKHDIEVFLAPANTAPLTLPGNVLLVLVLHDLITLKSYTRPTPRERLLDIYRRRLIPASVTRAEIVLTVSEYTRQEILQAFPSAQVRVIPCTVQSPWFTSRPLDERNGHILLVTSSAPHKNADAALQAYALYAHRAGSSARPLRIVGMSSHAARFADRLCQAGIKELVTFLPYLSDAELRSEYLDAGAMLFPSLDEGFGIPLLEAMATGTPVLTSRRASMPEVAAGAARYFDPTDIDDMATSLEAVLADSELSKRMAVWGRERAMYFHPERVGTAVLQFWEEIAGAVQ